jgi:hypothetical protein
MKINPIADADITNKWVIIKEKELLPRYRTIEDRLVFATGGFGCSAATVGSAVFVTELLGQTARWERYQIEGWVETEEAEAFKAEYVKGELRKIMTAPLAQPAS